MRDVVSPQWLESIVRDLASARRTLQRQPWFTGVAVLTFATAETDRRSVQRFDGALRDVEQAVQRGPQNAAALGNRGFIRYLLCNDTQAIADANASLGIDAERAGNLYYRGVARRRSGDASGGDAALAAALSMQPDIAEQMSKLGAK